MYVTMYVRACRSGCVRALVHECIFVRVCACVSARLSPIFSAHMYVNLCMYTHTQRK